MPAKISNTIEEKIVEMILEGSKDADILLATGVKNRSTVARIRRRNNITKTRHRRVPQEVEQGVIEMLNGKATDKEICEKFGINSSMVYSIKCRNNIVVDRTRKFTYDEGFFYRDTDASWYWTGFIWTDGCLHKHKETVNTILNIKLKEFDCSHLVKFRTAISATYNISHRTATNSTGKKHPAAEITLSLTYKTIQDLHSRNVTQAKTYTITMPEDLVEQQAKSSIRGVFDGDGCIYINKRGQGRFSIVSANDTFLEQILDYISKFTGVTRAKIDKTKGYYTLRTSHRQSVLTILDWLYSNSTPETRLDRKYEKYLQLKNSL